VTDLDIILPSTSILGFVAAILRASAFVAATPFFNRRLPAPGRLALAIAIALAITEPVSLNSFADLVTIAAANLAIGLLVGFVIGVTFHAFFAAGSIIDLSAGLGIGATFDPLTGANASVFDRFFDVTAMAVFLSIGGHHLMVQGLDATTKALPLDASVEFSPGLQALLIDRVGIMLVGMLQIAAPAIVALLVTELALGVAARLLPRANIFLVGMPARLLVGLVAATAVIVALPTMVQWLSEDIGRAWSDLLRGIRVT
jgi:flagellar biosynthetic protein FliR